ncbi:hypothetical protein [Aeromicrobium sp. UC242_57]|uniref:hypothetical protein n=1 Tax=Aeromicrobium sp. UC242_57 TaxID=3374624 RepID=UPI0037AFD2FE
MIDSLPHSPAAWGLTLLVLLIALLGTSMRVVPEHQRVVVTRLGRGRAGRRPRPCVEAPRA